MIAYASRVYCDFGRTYAPINFETTVVAVAYFSILNYESDLFFGKFLKQNLNIENAFPENQASVTREMTSSPAVLDLAGKNEEDLGDAMKENGHAEWDVMLICRMGRACRSVLANMEAAEACRKGTRSI